MSSASPDQARNRAQDPCDPRPDTARNPSPVHGDPERDPSNFTNDALGNTVEKGSLKDQLDRKAREAWIADAEKLRDGEEDGKQQKGVVDKVLSQIPGVSTLLGKTEEEEEEEEEKETSEPDEKGVGQPFSQAPPTRPEHDAQVEQFLRGQYQSRSGDGMPEPEPGHSDTYGYNKG